MARIVIGKGEDRFSRIRRARNVNDLLSILKDIDSEVKKRSKIVENLEESLSGDEDIRIDHRGLTGVPRVRQPKAGSTKSFVAPSLKELKSNTQVVQDLYENAQELDAVEALLKQTFSDAASQPQALKSVSALKAEIDKSILKALTALSRLASDHMPTEIVGLRAAIADYLAEKVDKSTYAGSISSMSYASFVEGNIQFSVYFEIQDLKDSHGFVYSEFQVVLTGVIGEAGQLSYYLTVLPDFRVPGRFLIGKTVSSEAELLKRLSMLLSSNDVVITLAKRPLPIGTIDLKTKKVGSIAGVESAEVKDDTIILRLRAGATSTSINKIVMEVVPLLNMMVGLNGRTQSLFKWKVVRVRGVPSLQFVLTPRPTTSTKASLTLNSSRLDDLSKLLDLSDQEVLAVKKALKSFL